MRFGISLLLWALALTAHAQTAPNSDDHLYQAFGQKAGIARVMEDFVARLVVDPRIGTFFKETNQPNLVAKLTEQLCAVSGGPCTYSGPPMKAVHADMEIGKSEFNALVEVLQRSMEAQGISFADQNRMLARLAPMHRDIINR
jgi:hemoglobin